VTQMIDAAGEAVFEQGGAENRDQALPMARGHARGGNEEAGELVDVVALRQSQRGQMLKVIAEQMIHGRR